MVSYFPDTIISIPKIIFRVIVWRYNFNDSGTMLMKKKILTVISILVTIALGLLLWNIFITLMTESGREDFKTVIMGLGVFGYLVLIGLTAVQVFLFLLPGEPIELLAGMCYGAVGGLIVSYLGVFLSGCLIFFLVRKVGKASVYDFIGKEKMDRIENSSFLKSGNAEKLLLLLFALPGIPKDFLVYIGALLPVDAMQFILLSTLFRFPGIITSTVVGESFAEGNQRFAIAMYAATFVVSVIVLRIISKRDNVKEIIEINKD